MVSSMQTAHFYRQRLDAGELYFLALDPLKNGGWRGLLVRHYARPEKAVKTTVPKMSFRLWEHVTSVPKEVEKRFNDAGNLGTMRNRKRNQSLEDLQGMLKMHQRRGDAEMTAYYKEAIAHAKKRSVSKRKKKPTKRSGKHRNRGRGSSQVGPSRASRTTRRSAGVHSTRFWGN